jgi:hypothetical protein
MLSPFADAVDKPADGLGLVAFRFEVGNDLKIGHKEILPQTNGKREGKQAVSRN